MDAKAKLVSLLRQADDSLEPIEALHVLLFGKSAIPVIMQDARVRVNLFNGFSWGVAEHPLTGRRVMLNAIMYDLKQEYGLKKTEQQPEVAWTYTQIADWLEQQEWEPTDLNGLLTIAKERAEAARVS